MKHTKIFRWIGMISAFLIFATAALPTAALTPAYPITGTYLSSTYYDNLLHLPRSGDKAFDAVAVALSQLDYHEGNGAADFDGENTGGYRNYTEYNHALGQIGGTYGYAWCAAFVSWCLEEADAENSAGGLYASCTLWVEALRELGQYSTRASGYTPTTGDLIFFRSAGVSRASDHVGLVRYVKGGRVYTVEGNSSDRVSLRNYALTDTYIVGYGRPRYNSAYRLPHTALECEDLVTGWYTVTNSFVNVRAGASSSATKLGSLKKGDMVRIVGIQNGWGGFYYKDKPAYLSLDYVDFTAPLSYQIRYDAAGGSGSPASHSHFSMEEAFVSESLPTREGYAFLGWKGSGDRIYQPGEQLPAGDQSLTAVWEAIPVAEPPAGAPPSAQAPTDSDVLIPGEGAEFLLPVPGDKGENAMAKAPIAESTRSYRSAQIAAGVTVGFVTVAAIGYGIWRKWREET
ncbi:MAG: CHAP domain-containing protein [Ruminococcaceae bacterium]|nr:CHAP domain-containing protein [Oscillospiraceae bacterium]